MYIEKGNKDRWVEGVSHSLLLSHKTQVKSLSIFLADPMDSERFHAPPFTQSPATKARKDIFQDFSFLPKKKKKRKKERKW